MPKRSELTPEALERARAKDRLRSKEYRRAQQTTERAIATRKLNAIRNRQHLNEKTREYRKTEHFIEWRKNYQITPKRIFSRTKTCARQRNIPFQLEFESIKDMLTENC